jgi:hypothetical protein
MNTSSRWPVLLGCAALSVLAISRAAAGESPAPPPVAAGASTAGVWQKHEYNFAYMGFTSTYSCDGLADKIKLLLLAAGARKDAKSEPGACASGFGRPDKFARASLTFYTLVPGAAENPGTPGTPGTPGSPAVAGSWRAVSVTDRSPRDIRVGDCELVEQFRNSVLPMFTARNIVDHTTCVPHQESGSSIDLQFESFSVVAATPSAAHAGGA